MTTAVIGRRREIGKRPHRPIGAQNGVGQLGGCVRAGGQAVVEVGPEPRWHGQGLDADNVVQQTRPRGLGMINSVSATHMITRRAECGLVSLHFEVVFTCFLRDNTPDTVLEALRWHLTMVPERPSGLTADEHTFPVLATDPDGRLPGGDFASLRRQSRGFAAGRELYAWGLFSRTYWKDDEMGELVTILDLIAPYVEEPGYGGYFREQYDSEPTVFTFQNGTYGPLKL